MFVIHMYIVIASYGKINGVDNSITTVSFCNCVTNMINYVCSQEQVEDLYHSLFINLYMYMYSACEGFTHIHQLSGSVYLKLLFMLSKVNFIMYYTWTSSYNYSHVSLEPLRCTQILGSMFCTLLRITIDVTCLKVVKHKVEWSIKIIVFMFVTYACIFCIVSTIAVMIYAVKSGACARLILLGAHVLSLGFIFIAVEWSSMAIFGCFCKNFVHDYG